MSRSIDTIAAEANRLYWESETSVADIAQQLELSRRALYGVVEPLPSGGTCATCGTPLVFENRSARNSGTESCPHCDSEEFAAVPAAKPAAATRSSAPPLELSEEGQRAVRVGGAALAGAALGAIATLLLVPRR